MRFKKLAATMAAAIGVATVLAAPSSFANAATADATATDTTATNGTAPNLVWVATFGSINRIDSETFKVELRNRPCPVAQGKRPPCNTDRLVELANSIRKGEMKPMIIAGVVRGKVAMDAELHPATSVNKPWHWYLDPTTVDFGEVSIESSVWIDGKPSDVEDALKGSPNYTSYGPWSYTVINLEQVDGSTFEYYNN